MNNKTKSCSSFGTKSRWISVFLCAAIIISCLPFCASAQSFDGEYAEGEIIISGDFALNPEDFGITSIKKLETYSEEKVYAAEIEGNVAETCRKLCREGIAAEPNYLFTSCGFSMPPEIVYQPPLYVQLQKPYFENILHVPDAWQTHEATGEGVTVAVIDSGFNINATDFPVNLWKNSLGTVGWNIHENSDNISPIYRSTGIEFDDIQGMFATRHGSNIAGIIGMQPNGSQFIGIAYNAELMLIKAASYKNDTQISVQVDDIIEALDFARVNGADIINFSLSANNSSSALENAVNRAYNAGIAIIASVANQGNAASVSKSYPAAYSNVIGVMAIDTVNPTQLADFSDFDDSSDGRYYDIAAPGTQIIGCDSSPNSASSFDGASQACAIASACAALYYSRYPGATVQDLYKAFRNYSADTVSSNPENSSATYSFRSLDAKKLLDYCPHLKFDETVLTDDTCTTFGLKQYVCDDCGYTYAEILPAHHVLGDWEITAYPTADSDGECVRHCQRCTDSDTKVLPAKIIGCSVNETVITGLKAGQTVSSFTLDNLAKNDVRVSTVPSFGDAMGTGSRVNVFYAEGLTLSYTLVLFGDVNGDGWYDGTDAVVVNCLANGILSKEQVGEAAYTAADCNHDGSIDENDVALLEKAGIILAGIDQSQSPAELAADSAFTEYLSLIDQSPAEEEINSTLLQKVVEIIMMIIDLIKSFVSQF